jgi:hypothetical protein
MEKLHDKLKRAKKGSLADNRFAAFAYKPLPAPFGLGSSRATVLLCQSWLEVAWLQPVFFFVL